MIGSAAAGIAHDLNNQLTLILNHLAFSDVARATKAANRCSALTGSLLSFCRGESLDFESIDLSEFLTDFVRQLDLPPGIRLITRGSDRIAEVEADTVALGRALTNLIDNACDAMGGSGELKITASERMIVVQDDGPGIEPEDLPHVFEPFFSTKGSSGTGLGLAIVRDIMRQHGGAVWVRSEPGCGAQFQLRFR